MNPTPEQIVEILSKLDDLIVIVKGEYPTECNEWQTADEADKLLEKIREQR